MVAGIQLTCKRTIAVNKYRPWPIDVVLIIRTHYVTCFIYICQFLNLDVAHNYSF
jgi:hypothetical protein